MCTRFYIESDLQPALESVKLNPLTSWMQEIFDKRVILTGEVRPTDIAAVIASNRRGVRTVFPMIWGFTRPVSQTQENVQLKAKQKQATPIVNCRMETAATKDFWRDSWLHHRCIVPASYYFEWGQPHNLLSTLTPEDGRVNSSSHNKKQIVGKKARKTRKVKYAIQPENNLITYLAGLYRLENGYPHFAILTREPGDEIRFIHNRMPVILSGDHIDSWIDPESNPEKIVQTAITKMEYMEIN